MDPKDDSQMIISHEVHKKLKHISLHNYPKWFLFLSFFFFLPFSVYFQKHKIENLNFLPLSELFALYFFSVVLTQVI